MPVYIAAGVGFTTCIRVCESHSYQSSSSQGDIVRKHLTLRRSIGYITECSCGEVSFSLHINVQPTLHIPQCLQRRRPPCWRQGRSWEVETHSCPPSVRAPNSSRPQSASLSFHATHSYSSASSTMTLLCVSIERLTMFPTAASGELIQGSARLESVRGESKPATRLDGSNLPFS